MTYCAYKYRLYPTPEQSEWLERAFAAVRTVYNAALEQRKTYGRAKGTDPHGRDCSFNKPRQGREINFRTIGDRVGLKDDPELSWITEAPRECLDAALIDLDKAFDNFFKGRSGFPSWRKYDRNNSLSFQAWIRRRVDGEAIAMPRIVFGQNCVNLPKIGRVRYNRHKKFYGDPKTVEVLREGQEYYVVLVTLHDRKPIKHRGDTIGVDLGVSAPIMLSNGEHTKPDAGLEYLDQRARKEARKLSRKKKGSNRREQQKRHLAAIKRKQARRRAASAHRATTEIVRRFRKIAIEDLRVKNMTASAKGDAENHGKNVKAKAGLNRVILNVSPFRIREQLEYKAKKYGCEVIAIDPKHTSQTCFQCEHKAPDNRKSQSSFICSVCGHVDNADRNAALNILFRADPTAGALARRKSPSEFHQKSATTKAYVSCFQPASDLEKSTVSKACENVP